MIQYYNYEKEGLSVIIRSVNLGQRNMGPDSQKMRRTFHFVHISPYFIINLCSPNWFFFMHAMPLIENVYYYRFHCVGSSLLQVAGVVTNASCMTNDDCKRTSPCHAGSPLCFNGQCTCLVKPADHVRRSIQVTERKA